jgi:hypothetical protein
MEQVLEKRIAEIEERLEALEKRSPPALPSATKLVWANPANAWLEGLIGLHGDDPDAEDAMRLGREYRERQPKC